MLSIMGYLTEDAEGSPSDVGLIVRFAKARPPNILRAKNDVYCTFSRYDAGYSNQ